MKELITAAEAALVELKRLHHAQSCQGQAHCPTAAAIADLEVEIAKAKLAGDQDPEFQAVSIDPHDVADAILRARPRPKARVISTEQNLPMHTITATSPQEIPTGIVQMPNGTIVDFRDPEQFPEKANVCPHCRGTGRIE